MSQSTSTTAKTTIPVPPLAPLDKAGASMRMLLYDTQLNLEKFSARVDKLTGGVEDARKELVTVQRMFEGDRDKIMGEMLDICKSC
ncbi:hypothetical protein SERLADRAFT_351966 [Serpula lacrymans var. lacrymans S7.9]|uniref:Uncharacterized protein n=1 Tax=Serpula lacrymans var. lacrymans (strain S7.9) TaxID=578457 RepID=F8P8L4_SERL9|nr:uncharacterized protein SERLADRAFT_351878 [Serpula lacrymans var. lacrymans S7.9]XP_007322767.1 uncharacterized protein SERLADRAFT_351719 [Serpula lacrymans var. lacrymans S7.9]XP_007322782.1 uncharacterized protein SERLADRAFT_351966 [Serpula lacrymans var. lacrymans S7.9]EGO20770.1 hypothetical protein SERLADRAFT_351878 [Serpula lacrymans var. lacrymans S7.9]EGO20801.1 hypothetical protein SERLADRAFT_351719 [Serpula lacrymans var. lacrymans S7.9]EGO20816.1 hypothetical protein SERLADRAFT_3